MLKTEIQHFVAALRFYTRIPSPDWIEHSDEALNKSRKYFPFIGWIIGGIGVASLLIFHKFSPL
ncbi:MAG: adenosylcobinamide-GDP ribazoletransferase [Pseudomonadota bacterium]